MEASRGIPYASYSVAERIRVTVHQRTNVGRERYVAVTFRQTAFSDFQHTERVFDRKDTTFPFTDRQCQRLVQVYEALKGQDCPDDTFIRLAHSRVNFRSDHCSQGTDGSPNLMAHRKGHGRSRESSLPL